MSHGLFRIPGYVASLRSGKVKGDAEPVIDNNPQSFLLMEIMVLHPMPLRLPSYQIVLQLGIAIMKITNTFHFAVYGLRPIFSK